jgi:fumarate hydratase class II
MDTFRTESDSLGEVRVPSQALHGASTQRAVENFPISGRTIDPGIIRAYGLIKWAAAGANAELGVIEPGIARLIQTAAREILQGDHDDHFPVDIYQTGSGTSTNMNVNEVIANRCSQLSGKPLGSKDPVHPNDHANCGQSSNDTFPSALHIAGGVALKEALIPALKQLEHALAEKAAEFHPVIKIGRTHLMDATPVRLGQEFGAYRQQVAKAVQRAGQALEAIHELPMGGTAVGTGLNSHAEFAAMAIALIARETGIPFREAADHFEAQAARDPLLECHGQLNAIAASLYKIANDLRLLASGPRCGLGEISLPPIQPGSSIMPGKANPVMCESLIMVAMRVFGNQTTVTWCGANGQLELNTCMPLMGDAVLESIRLLANACRLFAVNCVSGIKADNERCAGLVEMSLSMVTSLVPLIGYDAAAKIARQSLDTGITVRQLCVKHLDELGITRAQLEQALNPAGMADGDSASLAPPPPPTSH